LIILTRNLVVAALYLSLAGCLSGGKPDADVRGVLHGGLVWQGEVFVAGDVILDEDANLCILPRTRVRSLSPDAGPGGLVEHPHFPGSELIVKGEVPAVGTPAEPIIFESADLEVQPGAWGAINLEGSREAVFEYCVFRQADSAVHCRDSQVYIEQSLFEDNLVAIRFHDSDILIEHTLLRNNQSAIRFHFGSPVICENVFLDDDVNLPRNFWIQSQGSSFEHVFYDVRRTPYLGRVLIEPLRTVPSALAGLSWNP
jgi:hypothetical protein